MRAILASILVLQVLGSTTSQTDTTTATTTSQTTNTQFQDKFRDCEGVKSGTNLPKRHDGVAALNVPCYPGDGACSGAGRGGICCATAGTCERWISSAKSFYEGGCTPDSVNSSHPDYDPECTQVGECNAAYMFAARGYVPQPGTMTELPPATMDRLMTGSNWCSKTQRCQDTPCSEDEFSGCLGIRSGINLEKRRDGLAPLNEPCHSRRLCDGSIWCCVTAGTCVAQDGERGVFVGSNKEYYEGGCSPASLDESHNDYDPDCEQLGECHHPFIMHVRQGVSAPGAMTPTPSYILDRLMAGSNWNPTTQACDLGSQVEQGSASPASDSSDLESSTTIGLIIALSAVSAVALGLIAMVGLMFARMQKMWSRSDQAAAPPATAGDAVVGRPSEDLADASKAKGAPNCNSSPPASDTEV